MLWLCLVPKKFEEKCKGKKIEEKSRRKKRVKENNKNRFKVNKLFLYTTSNSFHLFLLFDIKIK